MTRRMTLITKNVAKNPQKLTKNTMRRGSALEILKSYPSITTEVIAKIPKISKRIILRDIEYLTNSKSLNVKVAH